jgi:Cu/Ag efflux protein CusF
MRKAMIVLAASLGGIALSVTAMAEMVDGVVTKVNETAGKITIKHGPIKKLDMDMGMTMVFRVSNSARLKHLKPGDKIKFEADRVSGEFILMKIEKLGAGGRQEKPLPSKAPGPAHH